MKIIDIKVSKIKLQLKKPFVTAIRRVEEVSDIMITVHTNIGIIGVGEAAPTAAITGETEASIKYCIEKIIAPKIIGKSFDNYENILQSIQSCIIGNTSAKAAVDIAIYDILGQMCNVSTAKFLGGIKEKIYTNMTVSVGTIDEMVKNSIEYVSKGYKILKIKVGTNYNEDIIKLYEIQKAVGNGILIRVDANQGWSAKESVIALKKLEKYDLNIDLIEQPVKAIDIDGMAYVKANTDYKILADESIFSPLDALKVIEKKAADIINIKLMKTGGIYNALKICSIAEVYGIECFIGSMLESQISSTAAVHLANAKSIITRCDLDGPSLISNKTIEGGAEFNNQIISIDSSKIGFGFDSIENLE